MRRVLVTGATGFLGSHVVRHLLRNGFTPIVARRTISDLWRLRDLMVDSVHLDLHSSDSIHEALAVTKPEGVIHCAAYGVDYRQQSSEEAVAINVMATVRLVEASAQAGVERFVHVGTCFEYGDKSGPISENSLLEPKTLYGATKAAGTILALERSRNLALPLCVVRPFGMYGPLEGDHKLVPLVKRACETKTRLPLTGGEQIRDYTYVGDVVDGILRLLSVDVFPKGEVFNVASGIPITLKEFISACAHFFGGEGCMDFGAIPYRRDEMRMLIADTTKWNRFYETIHKTPLEKGLAQMQETLEEA